MTIFDSSLPQISILADVPFPSTVYSGPGIAVNKGDPAAWTVSLDTMSLPAAPGSPVLSNFYTAVYDNGASQYESMRLDSLVSTATGLDTRIPIGDANYTVLTTDRYIALAAPLTVNRVITLPLANSVPGGREIVLQDEVAGLSPSHYWTVQASGSDTLDGKTSRIVSGPYGGLRLRSDGTSKWSAVATDFTTPISASYTATPVDRMITVTGLVASLTVTLPASASYQPGQRLVVIDQSGQCAAGKTITVTPAGGDLINNAGAPVVLAGPYLRVGLVTDGSGHWTIIEGGAATGTALLAANNLSDVASVPSSRANLGLGTMATQNAAAVAVTGGAIDGTAIGGTTPAAGSFTAATVTTGTLTLNGNNPSLVLQPPLGTPTTGNAVIQLIKPASGYTAAMSGYTATAPGGIRWQVVPGTAEAESGGNAGSNFQINAFTDAGALIGNALAINRANMAATFAGVVTPAAGIKGTATNDNATAGNVGEFISSNVPSGSAVPLTTGTAANITSISLTAGDWDVNGTVYTAPAGSTTTSQVNGAVSTTSATLPTPPGAGAMFLINGYTVPAGQAVGGSTGTTRISIASTTTVYLVMSVNFATSTMAGYGFLRARRVR